MSAAASSELASPPSSARPPPPFPPLPLPSSSSSFSPSPSSSSPTVEDDHRFFQPNQKHQHQNKSPFRRALQLIGTSKEQKESADVKREGGTNTEQRQQQEEEQEKMPLSLPGLVPCAPSSSSTSPLCGPMDHPLAQLMASFAAVAHHNQQHQRNASALPCAGPAPPPAPSMPPFLPAAVAGPPFLASTHPPPHATTDFNALLAIPPSGVLGPFIAGGVANAPPFGPPAPELFFAASQQPRNQHHPSSVNGTTNANNGMANNGTNAVPSGVLQGPPFTFPLDPMAFASFQHCMVPPEARRKNATREVTAPLKHWLNNHRKNPYPTKAEKMFLAVVTSMTLTQVSTWFANARRRLKKENKMTWSPRNRPNDEDDFLETDEGAEGTTAHSTTTALGAEGPSSPELELEEEEEEEEEEEGEEEKRDGQKQQQQHTNGEETEQHQQQQRQRRGIWSIADTLGQREEQRREWHNAKQEEEPNGGGGKRDGDDHGTTRQWNSEGEWCDEKAKVNQEEVKLEQHQHNIQQQQCKCEQSLHENQQRASESPRNGLMTVHCATANVLPPRSPHSLPSDPHAGPSPLDFLIGAAPPPLSSAPLPLLLPFPSAELANARHNLLFALQHQSQLHHHHHRSLMANANPMMAGVMFLAQQFAVHHQQMGGAAEDGGKQMDGAVTAPAVAEHSQKEKEDGPEEKRQRQQQRNTGAPLVPLPPQPPFLHLHHLSSSMSQSSPVFAGQKRAVAPIPNTESVDNGIPLTKRQCRAET